MSATRVREPQGDMIPRSLSSSSIRQRALSSWSFSGGSGRWQPVPAQNQNRFLLRVALCTQQPDQKSRRFAWLSLPAFMSTPRLSLIPPPLIACTNHTFHTLKTTWCKTTVGICCRSGNRPTLYPMLLLVAGTMLLLGANVAYHAFSSKPSHIFVRDSHFPAGSPASLYIQMKARAVPAMMEPKMQARMEPHLSAPLPRDLKRPLKASKVSKGSLHGPHITIISFTNGGMLEFAVNWLYHLEKAIGKAEISRSLLMYVVGEGTKEKLIATGLVPESCMR